MLEWIQITAEYSNAVLVAVLPHMSDLATELDLPIHTPITPAQIQRFVCIPWRDRIGGYATLTNGYELWYDEGHVLGFRSPTSYFSLQDPAKIPNFFGPINVSTAEALALARNSLLKIGYSLKETFADQDPDTTLPPKVGTNTVPRYRFKWLDPVFNTTAVDIEVDASERTIQNMWLDSPFFSRDPPRLPIQPKPVEPQIEITQAESNKFVSGVLRQAAHFSKQLDVKISQPLELCQIKGVQFIHTNLTSILRLTNGLSFIIEKGRVCGFHTVDSIYGRDPTDKPASLHAYLGKPKLPRNEAIALARAIIQRLGNTLEDFGASGEPQVIEPRFAGAYYVPRYFIQWLTSDKATGSTISVAWIEIDASTAAPKYVLISREAPQRQIPKTPDPQQH